MGKGNGCCDECCEVYDTPHTIKIYLPPPAEGVVKHCTFCSPECAETFASGLSSTLQHRTVEIWKTRKNSPMPCESVFGLHHADTPILVMVKFTGKDRKCWECGLNRGLFLRLDIQGEMVEFEEFCDNEE